jgi:16S rRNA (guanine527-N7)-methyltransferase
MADDGHAQDPVDGHPSGVPVPRPGLDARPSTGALRDVLLRSRELGFLGPGDVDAHVRNAEAFLVGIPPSPASRSLRLLDLGSGGGVPGLVIAAERSDLQITLLDAAERRTAFLEWAVHELGVGTRVSVVRGRAEELARDEPLRGAFDVVTARSFGPPAVTAECAVGFLSGPGSVLLVSEPPGGDPDRWPAEPLAAMGLRPGTTWTNGVATVRALDVIGPCPPSLPRRVGVPARRPRF